MLTSPGGTADVFGHPVSSRMHGRTTTGSSTTSSGYSSTMARPVCGAFEEPTLSHSRPGAISCPPFGLPGPQQSMITTHDYYYQDAVNGGYLAHDHYSGDLIIANGQRQSATGTPDTLGRPLSGQRAQGIGVLYQQQVERLPPRGAETPSKAIGRGELHSIKVPHIGNGTL